MNLIIVFLNLIILFLGLNVITNYIAVVSDVEFLLFLIFLFIVLNLYKYLSVVFNQMLKNYQLEIKFTLLKDIFLFCFLLQKYRDFLIKRLNSLILYLYFQKYILQAKTSYLNSNLNKLALVHNYIYVNYLNFIFLENLRVKKFLLNLECIFVVQSYKLNLFFTNFIKNTLFYFLINR